MNLIIWFKYFTWTSSRRSPAANVPRPAKKNGGITCDIIVTMDSEGIVVPMGTIIAMIAMVYMLTVIAL